MGNFEHKLTKAQILEKVSAALFELRDAMEELSLALRDWQFEVDHAKRKVAEQTVHQLLEKIAATRDSSA